MTMYLDGGDNESMERMSPSFYFLLCLVLFRMDLPS